MKKFYSLLLAALAACLLLCSCATPQGSSSPADITPPAPTEQTADITPAAPVDVEIWHTYTGDQAAYLETKAQEFNAANSAYNVKVIAQAYSGFADTVYNAVANGTGPSIIFNYGSTAVDYIEAGLAVNIADYIAADTAAGDTAMQDIIDSLPAAMKTDVMGFADGGIYYLPGCTTGPVFFYNKTIYDELGLTAPTTWDELEANCKAIYDAKGISGYLADGLVDDIQALFMQKGIGYIDTDANAVMFDTPEAVAVFQWFADNVEAGYFALQPTNDYASDDFNTQLVAGFSGSCVNDQYVSSEEFEIAIAPWIAADADAFYTAWNRGPVFLKENDAADKGAYEFVKFLLSPANAAGWAQVNSAISPYGTTEADADYQAYLADVPESLACVQANLDAAGSFPNVPGASQIRNLLVEYLTYAASGQMTAQEAIDGLAAACNEALAG